MIEQLARDEQVRQVAARYGGEYAEDIFQDALIRMMGLPSEKVAQLEEDGGTRYYFRQVVYHLCMERHRGKTEARLTHEDVQDEPIDNTDSERIRAIENELEHLHWYDRDLFLLYVKLGSSRRVQDNTGINYQAVCATVNKVKNELRNRLLHRDI